MLQDADDDEPIGEVNTDRLKAMAAREQAMASSGSVQSSEVLSGSNATLLFYACVNCLYCLDLEAMRRKNTYTKFCDSLLQKSAKVRSLVTDLKKNYESDPCVDKPKSQSVQTKDRVMPAS